MEAIQRTSPIKMKGKRMESQMARKTSRSTCSGMILDVEGIETWYVGITDGGRVSDSSPATDKLNGREACSVGDTPKSETSGVSMRSKNRWYEWPAMSR